MIDIQFTCINNSRMQSLCLYKILPSSFSSGVFSPFLSLVSSNTHTHTYIYIYIYVSTQQPVPAAGGALMSYGEEKASSGLSHLWSRIEALLACPELVTRCWKAPLSLFKLLWWRIRRRTACLSKARGDGFRWSWLEMGPTVSDSDSLSSA
jgi:hypothetical protein